jgi:hypothetical protein
MNIPPPTCRRCGSELVGSYISQIIHASEQRHEVGPDGSGMASILAATSACSWNCLAILAAQLAGPDADAAVQMLVERERQINAEGFEPGHDEEHPEGELATAGAFYALASAMAAPAPAAAPSRLIFYVEPDPWEFRWPLEPEWWKPKDRLRDLVRAGALLAAEADRDVRARRRERERF